MANLIVADSGLAPLLSSMFGLTSFPGTIYHLYVNNYEADDTMTIGNFTEAVAGTGAGQFPSYAAQTVSGWTTPSEASHVATTQDSALKFQPTSNPAGSLVVYGYFVTDSTGAILLWAETFTTPVTLTLSTQFVQIIPFFSYLSQYPTCP